MEMNYSNGTPVCPKTWMVESILVTILCCLPLGIVGIINASKVNSLFAAGDYAGAQKASADAGKWTKIGAIVGFVVGVIYIIFAFFTGFMAAMQ